GMIFFGSLTCITGAGAAPNWKILRSAGDSSTACTFASRSNRSFGSMVLVSTPLGAVSEGRNSCALRPVFLRPADVWGVELAAGPASGVDDRAACGRAVALVPDGDENALL